MTKLKKMSDAAFVARARQRSGARLFAALPLLLLSVYLYGPRPLLVTAAAVAAAILSDLLAGVMRCRPWDASDPSSPLFAVLLACLMPASVSYWVPIISTAVAVLVGKHLFGGFGSYPFHPTALGYMIAVVSWPQQMLTFPVPFTVLELDWRPVFVAADAPAALLKMRGLPNLSAINVLLGNFPGPMGAGTTLVVLACGLLLLAVAKMDLALFFSFSVTAGLFVRLFPRVAAPAGSLIRMELLTCALAFGAVFLLQDEVTAPRGLLARILYGFVAAVMTMLYQYFGSCPYGVCFGVLCANAVSGALESLADRPLRRTGRKGGEART